MSELPCLIFSDDVRLCDQSGVVEILPKFKEFSVLETAFFTSLRRGDRVKFKEFCSASLSTDNDALNYKIFQLIGFPPFRFAFCEKNFASSTCLNVVFLAVNMAQLYPLMSPASVYYTTVTGQIISELLLLAGSERATYLSPETLLVTRHIPTVARSLLSPNDKRKPCDIGRITEITLKKLKEIPMFMNTEITYSMKNTEYLNGNPLIIELHAEIYVHILTSVIAIVATISKNHVIEAEILPFALSAEVKISTKAQSISDFRNDFGNLNSLAKSGSANENLAEIASVLTYIVGIDTSVTADYRTETVAVTLNLTPESQKPGFKYRNPYESVDTVLSEFLNLLRLLG